MELFDHINKSNRFLGLGIVGVEELLVNPSQRQIIPLQGKPYEEDEISGVLTVEVRLIYNKLNFLLTILYQIITFFSISTIS